MHFQFEEDSGCSLWIPVSSQQSLPLQKFSLNLSLSNVIDMLPQSKQQLEKVQIMITKERKILLIDLLSVLGHLLQY